MMEFSVIKGAFILGLLCLTQAARRNELPAYVERCKINDPGVSDCLLKATEFMKPYLIKGIPELGVPSIENFVIPELQLAQATQALNFSATIKNVNVKGLPTYKFSKFDFDVPNLQWNTKMSVGPLSLEGQYNVIGTILGSPIKGNGKFTAGIQNADVELIHKAERYTKKGETYVRPQKTTSTLVPKGPSIHLDGLFDGDQQSSQFINNIIRDNIDDLFSDMKPLIEKLTAEIGEQFIYRYLEERIPLNKMYIH